MMKEEWVYRKKRRGYITSVSVYEVSSSVVCDVEDKESNSDWVSLASCWEEVFRCLTKLSKVWS